MTDDTKRDLKLLQLRGTFDPKRFYKSSDHKKGLPKFFQVGTVVESAADFYSGMQCGACPNASLVTDTLLRLCICTILFVQLLCSQALPNAAKWRHAYFLWSLTPAQCNVPSTRLTMCTAASRVYGNEQDQVVQPKEQKPGAILRASSASVWHLVELRDLEGLAYH